MQSANLFVAGIIIASLASAQVWAKDDAAPAKTRTGYVIYKKDDMKLGFTAKPRVSDGDSFSVAVRLFGIDTPEKKQLCEDWNGKCYPCGDFAKRYLKKIAGKSITCTPTGDRTHGRLVAYCFDAAGTNVSLKLLETGWAVAYRKFLKNSHLQEPFLKAEATAKAAKKGIWQGRFIPPHEWRKGKRLRCEN